MARRQADYTPKTKTPPNPYAKKNLLQFRVSDAELAEIKRRANQHERGHLSEYLRVASLKYRPR